MPPTIFVLFGATGDLARRMVLPAFAALAVNDLMPEQWVLIGNGRKDEDDAWFADHVRDVLDDDKAYAAVDGHLMFAGNGFSVDDPGDLPATVARAREQVGDDALLVHYIALPPSTFEPYVQALDAHGLAKGARVVFEKPYGTSPSAFDHLEQVVHGVLDEEQVYRLDHFPREGGDAEPARPAVHERDHRRRLVQPGRPAGADRRARDPRHRRPCRVLRRDRRHPGHGRHAPVPGGRRDRHGAAAVAGGR
jgi:hypothetical protein